MMKIFSRALFEIKPEEWLKFNVYVCVEVGGQGYYGWDSNPTKMEKRAHSESPRYEL